MRFLLFLALFFGSVVMGRAQQNYFVYLQTDNKQPFYVRVNDKLFSSSASGYLVVPKLQTGTHTFSVGFPKNEWPLQTIPVSITNKDQGYLLKNFESKGWGLFNIQTLDVVMASGRGGTEPTQAPVASRTDEFSSTLADVVNTPSIKELEKVPVKESPVVKTPETEKAVATAAVLEVAPTAQKDIASLAAVPANVSKLTETNTAEGRHLSYLVQNDTVADTVHLVIAADIPTLTTDTVIADNPSYTAPVAKVKADTAASAPKFIDIELTNPNAPVTNQDTSVAKVNTDETPVATRNQADEPLTTPLVPASPLKMINSDCKSIAAEEDFLKVRKKMISQRTEELMIEAAQKIFRQKCYSVEQVKNLSVLLLKEESKYKLFDTAYPFIHDTSNFRTLESQLSDPYFISRFRAMIRN